MIFNEINKIIIIEKFSNTIKKIDFTKNLILII